MASTATNQGTIPETQQKGLIPNPPVQIQDQARGTAHGSLFLQRIASSHLFLLKAALLEGNAALAGYREWRPTLDLATITYGQQRLFPLLQRNLMRLGIEDPLIDRFRG